jgi:HPt (histidine-containing phosphotransfer) domain-containing protein
MYSKKLQTTATFNLCDGTQLSRTGLCDLEGALVRLGGDRRLLTELVQIYIEDAPMLLMRISNGVRDANRSDVLHAAHLLAGLAANLGAPSVTNPAERLEEIAVAGRLDEAFATVEELQTQAARLEIDLQPYR